MRRLNAAAEAVLAFAVVNRRLPCPAAPASTGVESRPAAPAPTASAWIPACRDDRLRAYRRRALWPGRVHQPHPLCRGHDDKPAAPAHRLRRTSPRRPTFKANGISCRRTTSTSAPATPARRGWSPRAPRRSSVFSTGRNGALLTQYGTDETENTDGDAVFVSHVPGTTGAAPPWSTSWSWCR